MRVLFACTKGAGHFNPLVPFVEACRRAACVRVPDDDGGRRQEVREFRTTTAGLITLADWLRSYRVTVVGMESTGVYWRAIYYLLEDEFECRLFNAIDPRRCTTPSHAC